MEVDFKFEVKRKQIEKSLLREKNLVAKLFKLLENDYYFTHCQAMIKPSNMNHIKNIDVRDECDVLDVVWVFVYKNGKFKNAYFKDIHTNERLVFDIDTIYNTPKSFTYMFVQISNEVNNKVNNHLNSILFDHKNKIAEHFEPLGYNEKMYNYLKKMYYFMKAHIKYQYIFVNEEPIQTADENFCISLNILYFNLRMFYKKSFQVIIHHMMDWMIQFTIPNFKFFIDMGDEVVEFKERIYYFYLMTYVCYYSLPNSFKIFE